MEDRARTLFSREATERETTTRQEEEYNFEEPNMLDIPATIRDRFAQQGMSLRWIRVVIKGEDDYNNIGKRMQDGWEFVQAEEVPEMVHSSYVREEGRYSGAVCRGDLALAKMPTAKAVSRKEFYEKKSDDMMMAVNSQLENSSDSRMPIRNSSKSSVMKGRSPTFQD
tara:strand:- start:4322 stop:4825 length:504 start_codon:yes stop_codon:yes gene_type:complete